MGKLLAPILAILLLIISCSFLSYRSSVDDPYVQIGTQIWSITNLNTDTFRNGEFILYVNSDEAWKLAGEAKKPAYCYYGDLQYNQYTPSGKLYNYYAVNDPRGLAPDGWHIPSDSEWTVLTNYLGGFEVAGKKLKASNYEWYKGGKGSNEAGFNAVPGSSRLPSGIFQTDAISAHFWTSNATKSTIDSALVYSLEIGDKIIRNSKNNSSGMSIRLVKNKGEHK